MTGPHFYVRRRPDPYQGRALETLGHAIEYLVDSRMAMTDRLPTKADSEAVETLMWLSRCVFSECEEIVPMAARFKAWMSRTVSRRAH